MEPCRRAGIYIEAATESEPGDLGHPRWGGGFGENSLKSQALP